MGLRHRTWRWAALPWVLACLLAGAAQAEPGAQSAGAGDAPEAESAPQEGPEVVPPELLQEVQAPYPAALQGSGREGEVKLELLVGPDGVVQDVTVVSSSGPEFSESATGAARGLRFRPATVDGQPTAVRLGFSYLFRAEKPQPRALLEGLVRRKGNRLPLVGATVEVGDGPPVETDAEGRFQVQVPPGEHPVRVSAPGHLAHTFRETLADGQSLQVRYGLEPLVANPYETLVEGERETRTEVSRVSLREAEVREVPGTLGDPFRVVMLLPGVASVGSGISYPVVRGSQPAATGYFLDGVRVPLLFHVGLGPAVVHPDFVDGVDFFAGAPPARYGRLMGGVVEGRLSRPRDDRLHASAYADFINAGGFLEVPFRQTGTSVTVAGRVSYTGLLTQLIAPLVMPEGAPSPIAEFWDYQARVEQALGGAKLRLLAFGSSDLVGIRPDEEQSFSAQAAQRFHRADLRLRAPLAGGEGELGLTWGMDQVGVFGQASAKPAGELTLNQGSLAARGRWLGRLSEALELEVGGELQRLEGRSVALDRGNQSADRPDDASADLLRRPLSLVVLGGAYTELRWSPSPEWTVTPGLRADTYRLVPGLQWAALEPRLSVRRTLGPEWAVKAAAGLFHQAPTLQLALPAADLSGLQYGLQQGLQFDAGAEWRPEGGRWEVTLDGYVNPYLRAVEFSLMDSLEGARRQGILGADPGVPGLSYGAELMVRRRLGEGLFGWVSYSFNQSRRHQRFVRFNEDGTGGTVVTGDVPFAFQQAHVLNAAASWQLPGNWTLGAAVHFNTGRPQSGELASRQQRPVIVNGLEAWAPVDRDRVADLPPFFRLDARVARTWTFDEYALELSFELLNATISQEVYAYSYGSRVDMPGWEPVTDSLSRLPVAVPVVVPRLGLKGTY